MNRRPFTSNGILIITELAKKCMTQRELAKQIGISESALYEYMHGTRSGVSFVKKIEDILQIKLETDQQSA